MQKKTLTMLMAGCLLLGSVFGCGKNAVPEGETIEKPTILTHVYSGEDIALSEEYDIQEYLGIRDGSFVFLGSYFKETEGSTPEEYTYESYPVLCSLPTIWKSSWMTEPRTESKIWCASFPGAILTISIWIRSVRTEKGIST